MLSSEKIIRRLEDDILLMYVISLYEKNEKPEIERFNSEPSSKVKPQESQVRSIHSDDRVRSPWWRAYIVDCYIRLEEVARR